MNTQIKEKQLNFLQETVEYYSQDPKGRRCLEGGSCYYSPETIDKQQTSEGCAIGRKLSPELALKLDNIFGETGVSSDELFYELPEELQELGQVFLMAIQILHDKNSYWDLETNKGLSERGIEEVESIKRLIKNGEYPV